MKTRVIGNIQVPSEIADALQSLDTFHRAIADAGMDEQEIDDALADLCLEEYDEGLPDLFEDLL